MRAEKVQKRAARAGFDWEQASAVVEKIEEELAEVRAEMESGDGAKLEDELGDLLFAVVNLTRKAGYEAEMLLRQATNKFVRRFQAMEGEAEGLGKALAEMAPAETDALWERVKGRE
jgi:ATP diphosphatase